jgi:hypothetical protein
VGTLSGVASCDTVDDDGSLPIAGHGGTQLAPGLALDLCTERDSSLGVVATHSISQSRQRPSDRGTCTNSYSN